MIKDVKMVDGVLVVERCSEAEMEAIYTQIEARKANSGFWGMLRAKASKKNIHLDCKQKPTGMTYRIGETSVQFPEEWFLANGKPRAAYKEMVDAMIAEAKATEQSRVARLEAIAAMQRFINEDDLARMEQLIERDRALMEVRHYENKVRRVSYNG